MGKEINIENLKFNKIIIASDADIDGYDIKALVSGFFYRNARPLIEQGYVYYSCSPLYRIKEGRKDIYISNKKEYIEYIIKSILSNFEIGINNKGKLEKLDKKAFRGILELYGEYDKLLSDISLKLCSPKSIIETLAIGYKTETEKLAKMIAPLKVKERKKCLLIEGLTSCEEYVCIELNDYIKAELDKIRRFFVKNKLNTTYYLISKKETKPTKLTLIEILERVYNECTPKHKQRYKGLTKKLALTLLSFYQRGYLI